MARFSLEHCTAVITGASSGLGAEFARQLAPQADALVLVARREAEMATLAESLRTHRPALRIAVVPCDLADPDTRAQLPAHVASLGFRVNLLVNNAGLGDYGEFATATWPKLDRMIQVNIAALTHLAHAFLPDLRTVAPSGILNVSSLAGEMPIPDFAVYAATKAYVTSFTEALRLELRGAGVAVTSLAPGPIATGFGAAARRGPDSPRQPAWAYVPQQMAVSKALAALRKGRALIIPGCVPWLTARLANGLPRPILRAILGLRPRRSS